MALYTWNAKTTILKRQPYLVPITVSSSQTPLWLPDGRNIIVQTLTTGTVSRAPSGKSGITVLDANIGGRPEGQGGIGSWEITPSLGKANATDLVMVDTHTHVFHYVVRNADISEYSVAPSRPEIAYVELLPSSSFLSPKFALHIVALQPPAAVRDRVVQLNNITSESLNYPLSWSPNSQMIASFTRQSECAIVSVATGEINYAKRCIDDFKRDVRAPYEDIRTPIWDLKSERLFVASDGVLREVTVKSGIERPMLEFKDTDIIALVKSGTSLVPRPLLLMVTFNRHTMSQTIMAFDTRNHHVVWSLSDHADFISSSGSIPHIVSSPDGAAVFYGRQDATHWEDLWVHRFGADDRQISNSNPSLTKYVFGKSMLLHFRASSHLLWSLPLQTERASDWTAALILPADYQIGRRYPLIVREGAGSGAIDIFGAIPDVLDNAQLYATRGYAVLLPDVPIELFTRFTRFGGSVRATFDDAVLASVVNDAVDKAIAIGVADPKRLAIYGHSYGGYATMSVLVRTRRFGAAIDESGGGVDLFGDYSQLGSDGSSVYDGLIDTAMQGTPWSGALQRYISNSPFFYLNNLCTPILLTQGTADVQVYEARSDELFIALRHLGKTVRYVKYAGEGHVYDEWATRNQRDFLERSLDWYRTWLSGSMHNPCS